MDSKKIKYNSGFSMVQVLIVSAIIGIAIPITVTVLTNLSNQTKVTSDKDALKGFTNEVRNILNNESLCTSSIKKVAFTYPGIDTSTGAIPLLILDAAVNPAVKNNLLLNTSIPSFPIEFNLPDGRYISETSAQKGLPLKINSFKLYGAQMISENPSTRLYNASVFMQAQIDKQNSLPPMYVQSVNLSVEKSTNMITGCSTETSLKALCLAMGGQYDASKNPACSFVGGCQAGSVSITQLDGSTACRPIRELLGETCPPDHYISTNALGTGIECKTGKRLISFPSVGCWIGGKNITCSVTVNFMSALSAFDKANRNIQYITVKSQVSCGSGGTCLIDWLTGKQYTFANPYQMFQAGSKKKFQHHVDANLTTGDVLIKSVASGWGKASSGGARVANISIEIQLDGP